MKSVFESFFAGKRSADTPMGTTSTPVGITAYSQPHVLRQRMKEEKMTHGQTVTANISPVRIEQSYGHVVMYFCPMETIEVLETLNDGDGGSLPMEVKIEDLSIPKGFRSGLYTLKNVTVSSNGKMQVRSTSETIWEPIAEQENKLRL
ncbi:MAG TPA: hypothetical protein VGQ09_19285 [Chitinophagaceae bacterium]|jgi:hypothetical protein|nr:hypothetical protein [Chitinophagaceae bacterium]